MAATVSCSVEASMLDLLEQQQKLTKNQWKIAGAGLAP